MNNKSRLFNLFLMTALLLGACNLPSGSQGEEVSLTAAAQTVEALLSATPAIAISSTVTPLPAPATLTNTPLPVLTNTPVATATSNCNVMQFVTDVTYPDGTVVTPGQNFTKTWRLKNAGTCAWTPSYAIVFSDGNSMSGPSTQALTGNVNPGQTVDVSVNLTAPASPGDYTGNWKIRDAAGVLFGRFYVQIKVQNPAEPTKTPTPVPAIFAVTSVTYTVSTWSSPGFVNCPKITANITTNGAGTVQYHWVRSDISNAGSGTLNFASAGTQSVSSEWALGSVWAGAPDEWMGIYIDTPNNQDFGHATMPACTSP